LIAAFAAEKDRLFRAWWDRIEEQHAGDPRALLEALLSGIAQRIGHEAYRGCPFLNLATEFPDDNHPGRVVARATRMKCGQGSQPSSPSWASVIPTAPRLR
jgi:hypothetical protein